MSISYMHSAEAKLRTFENTELGFEDIAMQSAKFIAIVNADITSNARNRENLVMRLKHILRNVDIPKYEGQFSHPQASGACKVTFSVVTGDIEKNIVIEDDGELIRVRRFIARARIMWRVEQRNLYGTRNNNSWYQFEYQERVAPLVGHPYLYEFNYLCAEHVATHMQAQVNAELGKLAVEL